MVDTSLAPDSVSMTLPPLDVRCTFAALVGVVAGEYLAVTV
jgi:hypothetical protein